MSLFSDFTAHHKVGLIVFFGVLALLFVHEFRNKGADLASMEAVIKQNKADFDKRDADNKASQDNLQKQLAAIAQQKAQVIQVPSAAPQVIHDYIPTSTPIQQVAPITKDTKPDQVVGQLTLKNEQDLATFALSCKECSSKLATLQVQDANKDKQISDLQGSLKKAEDTAAGGSVTKRTFKVLGLVGCSAGGAWLGSKFNGNAKGAAAGGAIGATACALKFHFEGTEEL